MSEPGQAADPDKQAEQDTFKTQELMPRLAEAQVGKRRGLFRDAAHFVLGAYLSMVWCFTRLFIASLSGRQRFNVLGAGDAVSKAIFTVTNDTYINADSVCRLLTQIATRYAGEMITIVRDNARSQKCAWVLQHAASLGIELLYLPAYSPHLNLIERLWRYVRNECLYSKYYPKFDGFKRQQFTSHDPITIDRDKLRHLEAELPEQTESVQSISSWRASSPALDFRVQGRHVCFVAPPGSYTLVQDVTTITVDWAAKKFSVTQVTHATPITVRGTVSPPGPGPGPGPVVPPIEPLKKISRVTYVFEKDTTSCPRPVAAALAKLNAQGIIATEFEQDTVDGSGSIPAQYAIPLAAAKQAGLPALVVQAHFDVVRVVVNPLTEEDVAKAVKP